MAKVKEKLPQEQVVKAYRRNRVVRLDDLDFLGVPQYKSITVRLDKDQINNLHTDSVIIDSEDTGIGDNEMYTIEAVKFKKVIDGVNFDSGSKAAILVGNERHKALDSEDIDAPGDTEGYATKFVYNTDSVDFSDPLVRTIPIQGNTFTITGGGPNSYIELKIIYKIFNN